MNKKDNLPDGWMDQIKSAYPKRGGGQGWTAVERQIKSHVAKGVKFEDILAGTDRYAKWCEATGKTRTELVKMARTFYGRDRWWCEDYDIPVDHRRKLTYAEQLRADLDRIEDGYGPAN